MGATANMKAVTEQARGAQHVATEIHTLLQSKAVDMTVLATKVETRHRHALARHDEMTVANMMSRTSMIMKTAGKIGG